jgi:hypothetical protein
MSRMNDHNPGGNLAQPAFKNSLPTISADDHVTFYLLSSLKYYTWIRQTELNIHDLGVLPEIGAQAESLIQQNFMVITTMYNAAYVSSCAESSSRY